MNDMNYKKYISRGFTLIETFVAITILITAITGPMVIAEKGLQSAYLAKDQLVSLFLEQEGIEYIRRVRDNNCLDSKCTDPLTGDPIPGVWLNGLTACITTDCAIDAIAGTITACPSGGCPILHYDNTNNIYTYNTSDSRTPYTRTIRVTPNPDINGHEATLTSTVSWYTGPFTRSITTSEVMTDWE